jgi:hypothetical protein
MTHRKDLIGLSYKPLKPKGTKIQVENMSEKLKKQGKIKKYVLSKYPDGIWEAYGK